WLPPPPCSGRSRATPCPLPRPRPPCPDPGRSCAPPPWGHAVVPSPVCASFSRSFATVHHVIGGQNRCGSSAVPNVVSVDASEELADSVRRRTRMVVAWWSIIPFVLLLGCIAVLPLIPATEKIWDRNLVKLIVAL